MKTNRFTKAQKKELKDLVISTINNMLNIRQKITDERDHTESYDNIVRSFKNIVNAWEWTK